jgi:hypothetical protein
MGQIGEMSRAEDIVDNETLLAWAADKPRKVLAWIGNRTALLVAPIVWATDLDYDRHFPSLTLDVIRANLTAMVCAKFSTLEIQQIAASVGSETWWSARGVITVVDHDPERSGGRDDPNNRALIGSIFAAAYASSYLTTDVKAFGETHDKRDVIYAPGIAAGAEEKKVWSAVRSDCLAIDNMSEPFLLQRPLDGGFQSDWLIAKRSWQSLGEHWNFWINWYDDILAGNEPDWELLRAVALIPDEIWSVGVEAVYDAILQLKKELPTIDLAPPLAMDIVLQKVAQPTVVAVETMRTAMVQNRRELLPTFDAVLGFIMLEIERLQGRNYFRDEDDRIEVRRQINTLAFLHETVSRLQALVPTSAEMPQASVIEAEKLSRLFIRKYQEWPRANSDELVDRTCRAALVGATTVMLPLLGVTAPYALAAGMVLFSGKQMGEAAKFAIDLFKPGG